MQNCTLLNFFDADFAGWNSSYARGIKTNMQQDGENSFSGSLCAEWVSQAETRHFLSSKREFPAPYFSPAEEQRRQKNCKRKIQRLQGVRPKPLHSVTYPDCEVSERLK